LSQALGVIGLFARIILGLVHVSLW
jgi:hypothetical protein